MYDCDFRLMYVYIFIVNISINYDYYKKKRLIFQLFRVIYFVVLGQGDVGVVKIILIGNINGYIVQNFFIDK